MATQQLHDILARLNGGPSDTSGPVVHRCTGDCGAEVPTRGDYCATCATRLAADLRASQLAPAYASLPSGWEWARFGDPVYEAVAAKAPALHGPAKAWRRGVSTLTLLGRSGSGKTAVAVALAHRILDCARDRPLPAVDLKFAAGLRFVTAIDLATARREHRLGVGEPPALTNACRATLLILDELGYLEARHDLSAVQEVVDARYRASLPTIYTSGKTWVELRAMYGDATTRRVCELGQLIDLHPSRGAA